MASILSNQKCTACKSKGGSPSPLSDELINQHKSTLCATWEIVNSPSNDEGQALSRSVVCRNFACALEYINHVGALAEIEGHHPDLHITGYRTVKVVVYTHSIGGLCLNDFVLASKIELIEVDLSPKFLKSHPGIKGAKKKE
jgi:4a-hydroxytetrahydrobiopterin dehydratase